MIAKIKGIDEWINIVLDGNGVAYEYTNGIYGRIFCPGQYEIKRPPLGLIPRFIWEGKNYTQRIQSIKEAIERYTEENLSIPQEWVEEYNELIEKSINNG